MRDIIKRSYIGTYLDTSLVRDVLDRSIFSDWHAEVKDQNRFFYRGGARLNSYVRDMLNEQNIVLSKFLYSRLDYTKPYFATVTGDSSSIDIRKYRVTANTDDLISDTYFVAKRRKSDDELRQEAKDSLQDLFDNGGLEIIEQEDIDSVPISISNEARALDELDDNEYILSGEITPATSKGKVISFGDIDANEVGIIREPSTITERVTSDTNYALLDPLTLPETISMRFLDTDEEIAIDNIDELIVGRLESDKTYSPIYDIDGDGYISEDDIRSLRNSIGISTNDVSPGEWRDKYDKLDKDRNGRITSDDIAAGLTKLNSVSVTSLVIANPVGKPIAIEFTYYTEPYTTYFAINGEVSGGTFGLVSELSISGVDERIADGYIESTNGYILGINIPYNQIWAGRSTEYGWALRKVNYPQSDKMIVRGITKIDDVAFVILQGEDGYLYEGLTNIAIARFEMRKEVIEVTRDIISVYGVNIDSDETISGISSTPAKNTFRIFTTKNNIHTIVMEPGVLVEGQARTYASQGLEEDMEEFDALRKAKIYNDIDNFAYNLGIRRTYSHGNQ